MVQLFQEFVSPEQKKLAAMVEKMGGRTAVRDDEESMRKLSNEEPDMRVPTREESAPAARSGSASDSRHGTSRSFDFIELKREIESTPDEAIEKNLDFFNSKFELQKRQIEEAMERIITREGDRVISAVTAGPHDRIVDRVWHRVFSIYLS